MEEYKNNLENSSEQEAKPEELVSQMADTVNTIESIDEKPEDEREEENGQENGEKERELEEEFKRELLLCDKDIQKWIKKVIHDYEIMEEHSGTEISLKNEFIQDVRNGDFRDCYYEHPDDPIFEDYDYEIFFGEEAKEASHRNASRFLQDKDFAKKKELLGAHNKKVADTISQTVTRARYATNEFKTDHPGVHYLMFTDSNCDWFEARVDQNIADARISYGVGTYVDVFPEKYGQNDVIINYWASGYNPQQARYIKKFSEKYGENAEEDYKTKLEEMPKESRDYLLALTKNIAEIAGNEREGWDLIEEIDDGIMADKYKWTKVEDNRIRQMTKEEYYSSEHDNRQRERDERYHKWEETKASSPHENVYF